MADETVLLPQATPDPQQVDVPTQSYRGQIDLAEVSAAQTRLNMEVGAELDRTNAEFFAGQDIRRTQAAGAEQRLTISTQGEEERKTTAARFAGETALTLTKGEQERLGIAATGEETRKSTVTSGEQQRLGIQTTGEETRKSTVTSGEQQRLGIQTSGTEERKTVETTGEQERETIGKTATEQRTTDLQQEMFRRYKENRDYEQAQNQYRS
jgi:hypothetical protein